MCLEISYVQHNRLTYHRVYEEWSNLAFLFMDRMILSSMSQFSIRGQVYVVNNKCPDTTVALDS